MTHPNQGATKSQTSKFWFYLLKTVAAITLLLGAITGLIKATAKPHSSTASHGLATITFSGRVLDSTGRSIQGAVVIGSIDQSVGETKRSDTNGQFQFQVPAAGQSLRLSVSADGYLPQTIEALIQRTGPEEIVLQPAPSTKPVPPTQPTYRPHTAQSPLPPPTGVSAPAPPRQFVQNAPQGIAIGGDNNGTAVVNNYGPAPLSINKAQMDAVTQAVSPYSGAIAEICWEYGSSDTDLFVHSLQSALEAGGLTVKLTEAVMMVGPGPLRVTSGLAFAFQVGDQALGEAVAKALVSNGYPLPNGGFRGSVLHQPLPSGARMQIYVGAHQ